MQTDTQTEDGKTDRQTAYQANKRLIYTGRLAVKQTDEPTEIDRQDRR